MGVSEDWAGPSSPPFRPFAGAPICHLLFAIFYSRSAMNRSRVSLTGLIVLVLGLATAEGIYWFGKQAASAKSQESQELIKTMQLENQRKEDRDIEMGFGKVYVLVIHAEQWWTALPGYQQAAFLIAGVTGLIALTCFILAAQLR